VEPIRFGTDGVRGVANSELTAELALALGRAVARTLRAPELLIARDTRLSGTMLAAAFSAGAASEGSVVVDLGVLPTPGVAALCAQRSLPGVVISASHNPFADNGIKVLAVGGVKLSSDAERDIEDELERLLAGQDAPVLPTGEGVGSIVDDALEGRAAYVSFLRGQAADGALAGLHLVVDAANGAASGIAEEVLTALGATVTAIGDVPDGVNINREVGATSPEALCAAVVAAGADMGLALDGDADRCIVVDASGTIRNGDWIIALLATERHSEGTLGGGVVVTVMTNLGFHIAMAKAGIAVEEVPVGDRHVVEALDRTGWLLGGEQSGHIVFTDRATTGDGLLTGILVADLVARRGPLASITEGLLETVPQLLVNVRVADAARLDGAARVWEAVSSYREELGGSGRVVLRASGTEPLVRVMVEATDPDDAHRIADSLRSIVLAELGGAEGGEE
jgi:phosphoglucosamine mutase